MQRPFHFCKLISSEAEVRPTSWAEGAKLLEVDGLNNTQVSDEASTVIAKIATCSIFGLQEVTEYCRVGIQMGFFSGSLLHELTRLLGSVIKEDSDLVTILWLFNPAHSDAKHLKPVDWECLRADYAWPWGTLAYFLEWRLDESIWAALSLLASTC